MSKFIVHVCADHPIRDHLLGSDSWKLDARIEETRWQTDYNVGPEAYFVSYHLVITFAGATAFGAFLKHIIDGFVKWRKYTKDNFIEIEIDDVKISIRGKPDIEAALEALKSVQRVREVSLSLPQKTAPPDIEPRKIEEERRARSSRAAGRPTRKQTKQRHKKRGKSTTKK
ncbi:MAG TPA: hypothetical protein VG889_22200 [Rhizomicrobium sp.]|nr:hypothetical protein [Rhizomicrobium sp.]